MGRVMQAFDRARQLVGGVREALEILGGRLEAQHLADRESLRLERERRRQAEGELDAVRAAANELGVCVAEDGWARRTVERLRDTVTVTKTRALGPTQFGLWLEPFGAAVIERLSAAHLNAVDQARGWAQEARTQRSMVLETLRLLGARGRADYELLEVVRRYVAETDALRTALVEARAQRDRLDLLINTPHTADFLDAVRIEAAHQRERWSVEHDAGKEPADWFWLIGYLAGKALRAAADGDRDKALHHTISTAAVLANWHAHLSGVHTEFRPGHDPERFASLEERT